jgi:dihydroorotate dehydrogenase (fumarate)
MGQIYAPSPPIPDHVVSLTDGMTRFLCLLNSNVLAFSELIKSHSDPAIRRIGIIGVGGVTNRAAYHRMRQAGAQAVACATALGLEGVGIFEQLLNQTTKQGSAI